MKLTPHERGNPLWHKLKLQFEQDLAELRARNDSPGLNAEQTASIRGEIARVKKCLDMGVDDPVVAPQPKGRF